MLVPCFSVSSIPVLTKGCRSTSKRFMA
jgi:hypothetical protein